MSCVEKRHLSHRVGSMLHHRFPNGFTDLLMDETDREVSTLTDRAFRSLCVGDDAVYNDDFLYGYSPFSCHKPLAGEPPKKGHHKDSKKHGQSKNDKHDAQPWKQQQKKNISQMSSFLKALSATEESCEGMLIKNGGVTDSNGESWDKSALRSIQRELSEFSADYQTSLADRHYQSQLRHQSGDGSSSKAGKGAGLPSGKSAKSKNGKTSVKLRKLNIKNFFLHSEFSPFQTWRDFNRFPFDQEDPVSPILPTDNIPKWCDLPFYKELTQAHRKETVGKEDSQSCQKEAAWPSPPAPLPPPPPPPSLPSPPKPAPPPPPPKVLPKPSATPADKRCTSEVGDATAAPWRRNRSRATSAVPGNQPGPSLQENLTKTLNESLLLVKKEAKSVEVKAVEEVSSLSSTPFSICQLMTPLIPSRQPTETSEILQGVLSPLALDLSIRPHSEAKVTPEPPIKRDSYKALASSILFNLKDNRKRVKSRYSPPKFKTIELPESASQSPQSDHVKAAPAGSDGNASGLSTPAILKDGLPVFSPIVEPLASPNVDLAKPDADRPLSDDYLLSHLLQTKTGPGGLGDDNTISPFMHAKNKSPMAKKQNYPSLNLYKKANPVGSDAAHLQVPPSFSSPANKNPTPDTSQVSPFAVNKELPVSAGVSPNTLNVIKDSSCASSPQRFEREENVRAQNAPEETKCQAKEVKAKGVVVQSPAKEGRETGGQLSTMEVIRAAREAITAAKSKARLTANSDSITKPASDTKEGKPKQLEENVSREVLGGRGEGVWEGGGESKALGHGGGESTQSGRTSSVKKEPPPVPKRNFTKSDIPFTYEKDQIQTDIVSNGDLEGAKVDLQLKEAKPAQKKNKPKHLFSARQNNYIKNQRYAVEEEDAGEDEEGDSNAETEDGVTSPREARDSEHIINDLQALKTLQRAKLGDRVLENARKKLTALSIDEEARAKNDLISRELRNIKKGMLSLRGNAAAKREPFVKKEEPSRHEGFVKIDSNVIVNRALINDNYDKAKMALEEIISEREKRKNQSSERDAGPNVDEGNDESLVARIQQVKKETADSASETREKQSVSASTLKDKEVRDRLVDLRDHNHLRQILSQTEPRAGEVHRSGGWTAPPAAHARGAEPDSLFNTKAKHDNPVNSEVSPRPRRMSDESGQYSMSETRGTPVDAPPVPPRSRKGGRRSDESITAESEGVKYENYEAGSNELWSSPTGQEAQSKFISYSEKWSSDNHPKSDSAAYSAVSESGLTSNVAQPESTTCLSPASENSAHTFQIYSPTSEASSENSGTRAQDTCKIKRKAPLRPDDLATRDSNLTRSQVVDEEPTKSSKGPEDPESEALSETPRSIISPLLLVNGLSINQSPPDQASLSSKSSYFSVESALQRNVETESNVYHSLENLIREMEQGEEAARNSSQSTKRDSDRTDLEYYSLSDHESDAEAVWGAIKSPKTELEAPRQQDGNGGDDGSRDEDASTTSSLSNTFSPTLGIPALFKVKDNTFTNKLKTSVPAWSPRGSLSAAGRVEEDQEPHQVKEHPVLPLVDENPTSAATSVLPEIVEPEEIVSSPFPPLLQISANPQNPYVGNLLTVPQEEDRFSGVSPLSEGVESLTTSAADTADEMAVTAGGLEDGELPKVLSERSGSTCSGNDSQTGLPKPPAVLPKSEKAVMKAIKLEKRRLKKEEAQKTPQRPSHSGGKQRAEKQRGEKSEHKASSRSGRSGEKKHRERIEDGHHHGEGQPSNHSSVQSEQPLNSIHHNPTEMVRKTRRQSYDSVSGNSQREEGQPRGAPERRGRASDRHVRDRPETRHYSSDRVISNVPVYKAQVGERSASDRPTHRTQSIDRYLGEKAERRFSADMGANEKADPRSQRVEKSIMDEFQQRGRARDKPARDTLLRRSHSIDAYSTEAPKPSALSRQSSYTSQLSRQSSIEHAIVTQSFPLTQRKLLQDPDSGQYFFVDMPVQVKTKTFFDPETGSYVQLPVQPPEGAVPQASPIEVLTPPMVVYHSFVPVPLSPMAQKAPIQAPCMEANEFEMRHQERMRQMHCKEGQPYLEPVYTQHDLMLGEFMGTEELDCPR